MVFWRPAGPPRLSTA